MKQQIKNESNKGIVNFNHFYDKYIFKNDFFYEKRYRTKYRKVIYLLNLFLF